MIKNLDKKIKGYALKNAIHYGGRANSGSVISALFNEGLEKSEVKSVMPKIQKAVEEVSKLNLDEQKKEFEKFSEILSERESREGLPELPNTKKGVFMRFAPSASGPLHVGHAIVAALSIAYVKKYGGKFYLRIEDTNPENIDPESYNLLKKEGEWLSGGISKTIIQSDRIQIYYKYIQKLLNKEKAYVCECTQENFKNLAQGKKECPCRNLDLKTQKERWKRMLAGKYEEGEAVLRFKSDMGHKNPAMRDFPLARINKTPHPRQGTKYFVWPLMNLSVAVDDIELKMTHIIRGKDHRDNSERQKLIFEALGKKFPWTAFIGRIHFKDLEFSTTKFKEGIKKGIYSGWDDSKLPTLLSIKKKGYKPETFLRFAEHVGITEVDKTMNSKDFFELLDKFNKNA